MSTKKNRFPETIIVSTHYIGFDSLSLLSIWGYGLLFLSSDLKSFNNLNKTKTDVLTVSDEMAFYMGS